MRIAPSLQTRTRRNYGVRSPACRQPSYRVVITTSLSHHSAIGFDMSIAHSASPHSIRRTPPNAAPISVAEVFTQPELDRDPILERRRPMSLKSQGIKAAWFLSGIRESNCALFHASLYPIFPALRFRIEAYLENHQGVSQSLGPFAVTHILNEIVAIAFTRRDTWTTQTRVLDWLTSFIELATAP